MIAESETFWTLLKSAGHWEFEIFLMLLFDFVIGFLIWQKLIKPHIHRDISHAGHAHPLDEPDHNGTDRPKPRSGIAHGPGDLAQQSVDNEGFGVTKGLFIEPASVPRPQTPQIFASVSQEDLETYAKRVESRDAYKDLSTVWVMPTRKNIAPQVVESWMFLRAPQNQKTGRVFVQGFDQADAYNSGIDALYTEAFKDFRYVLIMDDDNIPPRDGLLRLLSVICDCETPCLQHFSVVGGLYWAKGGASTTIFGDPRIEGDFTPQEPIPALQECNGLGLGFTLFHAGLFHIIDEPWFRTTDDFSCDLYMMNELRKKGFRIACRSTVKVGHLDVQTGEIW